MNEKLFDAIRANDLEGVVSALESNPESINTPDQRGFPPLLLSTYTGNQALAKLILDKGANINAQDASGNTALM